MKALIVFAIVGLALTGYLTFIHYQPQAGVCPLSGEGGCFAVTSSTYSTMFGIPVSILGFLVYLGILYAAIKKKENWAQWLTLLGITAAVYFNYLMYFKLNHACFWCESSHATMTIAFILAHKSMPLKKILQRVAAALAVGIAGGIIIPALSVNIELADCITQHNVTMYGAWWCPHCAEQKTLFGSGWKHVNYIECSTQDRSQTDFCTQQNITGYPTWEFSDGKRISGVIPLERLAEITGC